jgi:hypothetical protein
VTHGRFGLVGFFAGNQKARIKSLTTEKKRSSFVRTNLSANSCFDPQLGIYAMRIFVVFNLKPSVDPAEYEAWAKSTDIPTVRGLGSINGFDVYRSTGLLGADSSPPYAYVELIEVGDDAGFGADVNTPRMQEIAAQFQQFADNPQFIVMQDITEAP